VLLRPSLNVSSTVMLSVPGANSTRRAPRRRGLGLGRRDEHAGGGSADDDNRGGGGDAQRVARSLVASRSGAPPHES